MRLVAISRLRSSSSTFASGSIVRISKIEIIGRKRRNRNSSVRNSPIVPTNVDQSQNVGAHMPHDEGRKSRCRLVTMIDEPLEPHADVDDERDARRAARTLVRTRLNHSSLRRSRRCREISDQ